MNIFLKAVDPDSGILSYEISNQNKFSINQWSGWVVTEQTFFNEDGQIYQLNIVVKDNEGRGNYSQDTAVVKVTQSLLEWSTTRTALIPYLE